MLTALGFFVRPRCANHGRRFAIGIDGSQEGGGLDAERMGNSGQRADAWISLAPLQVAQIAALHARIVSKRLLGQAKASAMCSHVSAQEKDDVHHQSWDDAGSLRCPLIVSF